MDIACGLPIFTMIILKMMYCVYCVRCAKLVAHNKSIQSSATTFYCIVGVAAASKYKMTALPNCKYAVRKFLYVIWHTAKLNWMLAG